MLTTVGFDADDTLWHNENHFVSAHARFAALLARRHDRETVEESLHATEMRNLPLYGYGIKGFALSSIETALHLEGDRLTPADIGAILAIARDLLSHPVELLDGASDVVPAIASTHRTLLLTKGDLRDQQRKIDASGLGRWFEAIEIVTEKDPATYRRIFDRRQIDPSTFVMVGNSLRSDVLPVLECGAHAVWIPYPLTWKHEHATAPTGHPLFAQLDSLGQLQGWLASRRA